MKTTLLIALLTSTSAMASDQLIDEILCRPTDRGRGVYVAVQTNKVSWVQRISIRVGAHESEEIGSFTVTVDQPTISTPGWESPARTALYQTADLELTMAVADGQGRTLLGPGHVNANLPNLLKPIDANLLCRRVR